MINITFPIQGLRCENCVQTVSAALGAMDGVAACHVDLDTGSADIEYDPDRTSQKAIADTVELCSDH